MTDPRVEFPHDDEPATGQGPLVYYRDGTPAPLEEFEAIFGARLVAFTNVVLPDGQRTAISTIFLGLDHGLGAELDGGPVLYETATFAEGGAMDRTRSRTEDAARRAHAAALDALLTAIETAPEDDPFPTGTIPRDFTRGPRPAPPGT